MNRPHLNMASLLMLACLSPLAQADVFKDMLQKGLNEKLQQTLGVDGDAVLLGSVSAEQEQAIGDKVAGRLLGQMPLVDDKPLQNYVNKVGRWVALHSERPGLNWVFGVVEHDSVNAWAIPGGYVFLTRGLYQRLRDEAELAGVLGHEIAHVQQKHHLKLLKKGQWLQAGTQMLNQELQDNARADAIIGTGAELLARRLDQGAEFEADRMGVVLAARAGYEPLGLAEVLQALDALASEEADRLQQLFSTHPQPADRLAQLDAAIGDRFARLKGSKAHFKRLYRLPATPKP